MEGASKLFPCSSSYHPSHLPATNKATSQPGVRAISSHPYPAAQGRLRPVALGWLFDVHKAKEVFAAGGDEVCRGSGSCWDVTPQPHANLPLQHSSLEAPAHQPETCCRCCAPRVGAPAHPRLGGHVFLPPTRTQISTAHSGLSLQTMPWWPRRFGGLTE